MSRKLIWFYNVLLLGVFAGVLAAVNPLLSIEPIGFSAVFLTGLAILFAVDWMLAKIMDHHHRLMAFVGSAYQLIFFSAIGTPGWAILSIFLVVVSFWALARSNRRQPGIVVTGAPIERAARGL